MNFQFKNLIYLAILTTLYSCNTTSNVSQVSQNNSVSFTPLSAESNHTGIDSSKVDVQDDSEEKSIESIIKAFVPKEYIFLEMIDVDFDKDGRTDYFVIIQGTKREFFEKKEDYYEEDGKNEKSEDNKSWLDDSTLINRNPRGYLLVMNRGESFEVTSSNYDCFSSGNERGVFFEPELYIEYYEGDSLLDVGYYQGRYGSLEYQFRYNSGDFDLVGEARYEGNSWIEDYVYQKVIDYEKGIVEHEDMINADDHDDENFTPEYKEWEEKISIEPLVKMSEGKWE